MTPARKHILIADRNSDFLTELDSALSQANFSVKKAGDGESALALFRQHPPDLAIFEVVMPNLLGTEVCLLLKNDKRFRHIPIILTSATVREWHELSIEENDFRADDFLLKPFPAEFLLEKVWAQLKKPPLPERAKDLRLEKFFQKNFYDEEDPGEITEDFQPQPATTTAQANDHFVLEPIAADPTPSDPPVKIDPRPLPAPTVKNQTAESMKPFRVSPRVPLNIPVNFSSRDVFFSSPMVNISKGGIFVRTENLLPIGSVLKLEFSLPDQATPIRGYGRVIWAQKPTDRGHPGLGIRFKDFDREDQKKIFRCVMQLKQLVS